MLISLLTSACNSTGIDIEVPPAFVTSVVTATSITTQTPIPTVTPIPTETPVPLFGIDGTLFFDQNGSGLKDESEPVISNFTICIKSIEKCINTNDKGNFLFENVAPENTSIQLSFSDPNADTPELAFRYINLWKSKLTKPAFDIGTIKVPEQKLNVTEVIPIVDGLNLAVGSKVELGLMQGLFTLPFPNTKYYVWTWFDLDSRKNSGLNWKGETSTLFYSNSYKIDDDHYGIDWLLSKDTYFVAPAPAIVREIHKLDDETILTLEHPGTQLYTHYGHLEFSTIAVHEGDHVERGQYIASLTKSPPGPGDYPLPNMLHGQIQCCLQIAFPLVQKELFDFYRSSNSPSYWTVDNDPRFYP